MDKDKSDQTIISWKAPEFLHYKKNQWWFPIQAFLTLALATLFVLLHQYIVAIIVVVGAIIIYRLAHQEPEVLPVLFSHQGIKFNGRWHPFDQVKSFWIIETSHGKRLHLQPLGRYSNEVVIPLVKQDVAKVRDFLKHYLPETAEVNEGFADRLNRYLKI